MFHPTDTKSSRAVRFAWAVSALATGIAVASLVLTSNHVKAPIILAILTLLAAGSYIGSGLIIAARRPANSIGSLLVAIGFAAFLTGLQAANRPGMFVLGLLSSHVMPVLLVHLMMVFPSGRFESNFQRGIVALGYVDAFILAFPAILVWDPHQSCVNCPQNPLLLGADEGLRQAVTVARLTLDAFVVAGLAIAEARRWQMAIPTLRAVIEPVIWSGHTVLAFFFVAFVSDLAGSSDEVLFVIELAVLASSMTVPFAIAFAFIQERFTRAGAVGDLVALLANERYLEVDLSDTIARALDDPTLELAYWFPQQRCYVNRDGQAIELPRAHSGRLWYSVELNGDPVAAIVYDESIGDESDLVRAAGGAAALSLENKRLEAALRAHVKELRKSRARLIEATHEERKRLERNLHDGAQQHLLSIALNLQLATLKIDNNPLEAREMLEVAASDLTQATEELRELARGIHPAVLTDQGLSGALKALADRSPVRVELNCVTEVRLTSYVEATIYYFVAEALTNVARHAKANSAAVRVVELGEYVSVEVRDDGVGGAEPLRGSGLRGLADRISVLDGRLEIESLDGGGTTVRAVMRRDLDDPENLPPIPPPSTQSSFDPSSRVMK